MGNAQGHNFPPDVYEKYKKDGFSEDEIEQIWKDREIMVKLYFSNRDKPQREITSSTYESAQIRLNKDVQNWFVGNRK